MRANDVFPLFHDYPPAEGQLSPDEAEERLKRAGSWRDRGEEGAGG